MRKKTYVKIISFLSFFCVLLSVTSVVYMVKANRYSIYLAAERERSLCELSEALDSINVSLQKSLYTSGSQKLLETGNELSRFASVAKDNLSELTHESLQTETIFKFLSQVGDYTISLAQKEKLSKEDRENLKKLFDYSSAFSQEMGKIAQGYYDGEISFEKAMGNLQKEEGKLDFISSVNTAEQSAGNYPTLLYDGPFSESILNRKSEFLEGKKEVTKNEAKELVAKIAGVKTTELKEESDCQSAIPLYCFSLGEKTFGITKSGGYLCYMTNPHYSLESTISKKEAIKRGENFLSDRGFRNMVSSYYSEYDGVCTINYACKENGIICYADLIKVSIALDTGKVVAFDSSGYLMNHKKRKVPQNVLSEAQCRKSLFKNLQVLSYKAAFIPLESGKEEYCMEYHCRDSEGQEVLIYINRATGIEENILLLLYSDNGILTK